MNTEHYLSDKATDSLQKLPTKLNYENLNLKTTAGYFVYQVKKKVAEILETVNKTTSKNYNLETEGLKIYTTLNYRVQEIAEKAAKDQLVVMQKQLDKELQSNRIKDQWFKTQEGKSQSLEKDKQNRAVELFDWDGTKILSCNKFDSLWYYAIVK